MTNKKALRLLRQQGFTVEMTHDGHCIVSDADGVIGKMRKPR